MITVKFNIGSKSHKEEFENHEELGKWIVKNYRFRIIDVEENKEGEV